MQWARPGGGLLDHPTVGTEIDLTLVLFAPTRYMMVKITCFSSDVVLQITKHTMVYPGSCLLLGGNSPISSGLILKMNRGYNGGE
jgi:hypothetical protein